ncbi:dihydrodipicolinate synthase [Kiloniella spongiae]|uniref:4-hydroxy-tetrahydrodipicolinate synthase n=1 Tax=Kiloniella spongiae TaxID=1489064 RepID=A0A0H2MSW6_9PROT|nr:4-hydroxy-tetrahydrodipicolinate synthase [Kiloniella spongiae]KLN59750.1 dihydrodipicolinate synthase [Kiloniella spongiae]
MTGPLFRGSFPALATPMLENGDVDEKRFQNFVQWQIDQGSHAVCPVGTTGESPTLGHDEHKRVTELCIEVAKGKVPVIAGAGSNSTREAIDFTRHAQDVGADAALVVTPYYNKPSQEGLYQHFKAIHDNTDIPIILYDVPGRSIVNIDVDTVKRLSELPRIQGIKDATADLALPVRTRLACGDDFTLLSGEDATIVPFLSLGGHGCISVTANIAPKLCSELHEAWWASDFEKVSKINDLLTPLHEVLFVESSPGPVKYGMNLLDWGANMLRLPLLPVSKETENRVRAAMVHAGLIDG